MFINLNKLLLVAGLVFATSCVTSKPSFEASEVVERMPGVDETPEWTNGSQSMIEEGSNAVFVSTMRMSGNSRSDACLKGVALSGKADMLKYVKQSITASAQLNDVDAASDPAFESLTAALSQGDISGAKVLESYWQKVEESDESGARVLRLICSAKVGVNKAQLAKMLREATSKSGGNAEIRERLLNAQKEFIDGLSK